MRSIIPLLACALLATACGSTEGGVQATSGQADPDSGVPDSGVGVGEQWVSLVEGHWQLAPGEETYKCARKTLDQDLYIRGFRTINPIDTHHMVLVAGAPQGPDGIAPCSGTGSGMNMIFGSAVGTNEIVFPDGLGLHVKAGQQLVADVHLFNTSANPLEGDAGAEGLVTTADKVTAIVDNLLAGPQFFFIPPNQTSVVTGNCTMEADTNIIAVQPHMHWLATHQKVVAKRATGDVVLHDAPFSFDSQIYYPVSPALSMVKGEKLQVECTYDNTTGNTVTFGTSTTQEMCLVSVYRYPASGSAETLCAN